MNILVINAGSSSLKYQLIDTDKNAATASGICERIGLYGSNLQHKKIETGEKIKIESPMKDHSDAVKMVLDALVDPEHGVISSMDDIDAIGHRVVHGGEAFADSCIITDDVLEVIKECTPLAPLHNPANIIGIEACEKLIPNVPQVAVFDTAFHQTMPEMAYRYAIPNEYYTNDKIRKYGFHGTSHKFVSQEAAKMVGKDISELKIITCHLGGGASVTAVDCGKSVDTSMGFTPLDGTVMGTRCGSIDPAVVTFLINKGMNADKVNTILNKESGVAGISEVSSDFRDLWDAADAGNEKAKLALDMFIYSVKKYIGAYAAAMGGVDVIVFAGGIGENDEPVRKGVTDGLEFLGVKVDPVKNHVRGTADITADGAKVKTLIISTNEELMIATDTKKLVEAM